MKPTDPGVREAILGLLDVCRTVLWWISVTALLFILVLPSLIQLNTTKWTDTPNDPFLTYAADGASLALGTGIYMTNHPGTPLHEVFAGMTKIMHGSLAATSNHPETFGNDAMRQWIHTHIQTFVIVGLQVAPLGYFLLLLAIALGSARLFGNRWLALPAMLNIGSITSIQNFSVYTAMESFYPAVLVTTAIFGFSGRRSPWSLRDIAVATFWVSLLISLKLVHAPLVLIFLFLLYLQKDAGLPTGPSTVDRFFERFVSLFLPLFLFAFAVGVLAFKSTKVSARGELKLIGLMVLCSLWLGFYSKSPRLRDWMKQQKTIGVALSLIAIQFFIINAPMAWEAWVGFLLNAQEKFQWEVLMDYIRMLMSQPLVVWVFILSGVLWGTQLFRSSKWSWQERFPHSLGLVLALPFYLFWVANYRVRAYNVTPFQVIAHLCAFSCIGYLLQLLQERIQRHPRGRSRWKETALAFSVLVPIGLGGLHWTPKVALQRFGNSIRTLDHYHPETFDQGLDSRDQYTPAAANYLWLANMYSAFHFPAQGSNSQ